MADLYGTFLMGGDHYLPGALVLAYALRNQRTKQALACLVTDTVSLQARGALREVYDHVLEVEPLAFRSGVKGGRTDRNGLFSRFHALRLGPDGDLPVHADRLVFLDADVLPLSDYDTLFELPAPAGVVQEFPCHCVESDALGRPLRQAGPDGRWCWHERYDPLCPHGTPVPREITDRVAADSRNLGINASLWRLDPSMEAFGEVIRALENPGLMALARSFPWPEQQFATLLWSGRWHSVDIRFCSIGGYPELEILHGIHFAGIKPWDIRRRGLPHHAVFPDFQAWYGMFFAMLLEYPALGRYPALCRIRDFLLENRLLV